MVWPASVLVLVVVPVSLAFVDVVRLRWVVALGVLGAISFWIAFGWLGDAEAMERGQLVFLAGWLAVIALTVWTAGALIGRRARLYRAVRRPEPSSPPRISDS